MCLWFNLLRGRIWNPEELGPSQLPQGILQRIKLTLAIPELMCHWLCCSWPFFMGETQGNKTEISGGGRNASFEAHSWCIRCLIFYWKALLSVIQNAKFDLGLIQTWHEVYLCSTLKEEKRRQRRYPRGWMLWDWLCKETVCFENS